MTDAHKVCIIGSGPAGCTAAIYTGRALLKPVVISGYCPGGQLMTTTDVENFPGHTAISGPDMMEQLLHQAGNFDTTFKNVNVKHVDCSQRPFTVTLDDGEILKSESIIVATGAEAMWLDLEGEKALRSRGLSTCATCDGAFFKDEHLLVIGGGDSAMEEACFLTRYAKKVTIVHRRDVFRASQVMLRRAQENEKIEWMINTTVHEWVSENGDLCGAILRTPDGLQKVECGGVFVAIGHKPVTAFLDGQLETDDHGYLINTEFTATSVPGIFACGDVCDTRYKQAITASGEGCKAAMDCEKWLQSLDK